MNVSGTGGAPNETGWTTIGVGGGSVGVGGAGAEGGFGGTGPGGPCDCTGLGVPADAKLCPDGTSLSRTVCRQIGDGCSWEFADCPTPPPVTDAGIAPDAWMLGNCPSIPPGTPGQPNFTCSLFGSWFFDSSHGTVQSRGTLEIRSDGSYYGIATRLDSPMTYGFDGSFHFTSDVNGMPGFVLAYSCGDGCNGKGSFGVDFQNDCAVAVLSEYTTECTGNRIAMAGKVVLTRRP